MSAPRVIPLNDTSAEPEVYYLPPEKLISGNPKQTAWTDYTDPSGRFFAGFWQSEVGKWHIAYTEEDREKVVGLAKEALAALEEAKEADSREAAIAS